jgi:hypothetical protein
MTEKRRLWWEAHPDYARNYYLRNREKWTARGARPEVKKQKCEWMKRWQVENPEAYRERQKGKWSKYGKANTQASLKRDPDYLKKKWRRQRLNRLSDLNRRIKLALRGSVSSALRKQNHRKASRTVELLGCPIESFKLYIESKFEVGMSWENYGRNGWHIDHIMPCAIFDLSKPEHQKRCFHFSNLQPMWEGDNIRKSDTVATDQFSLL